MPTTEPVWLTAADLADINIDEVAVTGEPHLVRSPALLESAAARPRHLFHYRGEEDVVPLAVSLLFGVTQNHPFFQGNKRTEFTASLVFIELNGYEWCGQDDPELWGPLVIRVQAQDVSERSFAQTLRRFVR